MTTIGIGHRHFWMFELRDLTTYTQAVVSNGDFVSSIRSHNMHIRSWCRYTGDFDPKCCSDDEMGIYYPHPCFFPSAGKFENKPGGVPIRYDHIVLGTISHLVRHESDKISRPFPILNRLCSEIGPGTTNLPTTKDNGTIDETIDLEHFL